MATKPEPMSIDEARHRINVEKSACITDIREIFSAIGINGMANPTCIIVEYLTFDMRIVDMLFEPRIIEYPGFGIASSHPREYHRNFSGPVFKGGAANLITYHDETGTTLRIMLRHSFVPKGEYKLYENHWVSGDALMYLFSFNRQSSVTTRVIDVLIDHLLWEFAQWLQSREQHE